MTTGGPYKNGQRFGSFTLESYIGSGAFKSVYKARNESKEIEAPFVALGFPHKQDSEGLKELEKEFTITSRLGHPNILQIHTLDHEQDVSFLVMEYLEGLNLREKVKAEGALPADEALRYVGLISDALAYAHSARVFHRDIKPENIFITTDRTPKLLDFGVARMLARTSAKASSRIGTIEYMAPETLQGASGSNADLWSLGVTLYELLTGDRPFTGEVGEVIQKIMLGKYDEKPLFEHNVDPRIIRVIRKMLCKEPDGRYQLASELTSDLEAVARRTRMMDSDESRLEILIRASFPLVYISSFEEDRIIQSVKNICERITEEKKIPRKFYLWSASLGLRDGEYKLVHPDTVKDPTNALVHVIQNPEDAIYLFLDIHHHFTPVTTRLIRDVARAVRETHKSVLFLSPWFTAPDELQTEVSLIQFHLPDRKQLEPLVDQVSEVLEASGVKVELEDEDKDALIRSAQGLTLNEAERALYKSALVNKGLITGCDRVVAKEKTQQIRKSGILELYHKSESFMDVGGLEKLMAWFKSRMQTFSGASKFAGLPQPKGVLLVGVPGCGKSLTARALAGTWGVPLLRLDLGRIFGSIVGQSESNLRQAIQTAEAVSPCILWIDEVEKGFSGVQSQSGGGVTQRVFGTFLSWLQEKRSPVFVVATANDISGLPPEFLRGGRFDDIFFVGLPKKAERETIFKIHISKRNRDSNNFDLNQLVGASKGFSGAEIEQAVVDGMFRAFNAERDLETDDVIQALQGTYPLSKSRANEIRLLVDWATKNAKWAS